MSDSDLLWPRYADSSDVPAIERIPLAERGLPESTYAMVQRARAMLGDRIALRLLPAATAFDAATSWTYAQLADRVEQIARALLELGVRRGPRTGTVSIMAPNGGDMIACLLAAEAVGTANPINPALAEDHAALLLRTAETRVLVAAGPRLDPVGWEKALALAADVPGLIAVLALVPDGERQDEPTLPADAAGVPLAYLHELADAQPAEPIDPVHRPSSTDPAAYFHTGGTTGAPKLAAHTHANAVAMSWMIAANESLTADDVLLGGLPLFHVNAVYVSLMSPLFKGSTVVWTGPLGFRDPQMLPHFWKLVERFRIATFSGVPTVYAALTQVPLDADISSLRYGVVGAAPLPPEVRRRFEAHTGVPMLEGYGMTEATCASTRSLPGTARPGTVGQRTPYTDVRIVREDGSASDAGGWQDCAPSETGLVVLRGPSIFAGYLRSGPDGPIPDPTGKVFDGWLDTGDLGSLDEAGYLTLRGRVKDLIIRGGHNLDPADIEDALMSHPDVMAAAAIGRPDAHSGEVPVAYVTLRAGSTVGEADLIAYARERVAEAAAAPKSVTVLESLPVTEVGKPFKPALRRDALRRVVSLELERAGVRDADRVRVEVVGGEPVAVIPADADTPDVAAALGAYAFRWRLET